MLCNFEVVETGAADTLYACRRCGRPTRSSDAARDMYRRCLVGQPARPYGIGDRLADVLGRLGFRRKCGGCQRRQAWLNQLGRTARRRLGAILARARSIKRHI